MQEGELMKIDAKVSNIKYEKFMFYFILIDLLFLPYIRILSIKVSMLAVIVWYLRGGTKKAFNKNSFHLFLLFIMLSIISLVLGLLYAPRGYSAISFLMSNVQIVVITWFSFLFFYYFRYQFFQNRFSINKTLMAYLFFALFFAILFWVNPQLYFDIRQFWTLGNEKTVFIHHTINRFTHIVSEPNNFSVVVIGIMAYFRFVEKLESSKMLIVYIVTFFLVITTMSTTGMLLFVLYFFAPVSFKKVYKIKLKNVIMWFAFTIGLLLFIIIFHDRFELFFDSTVVSSAIFRYEGYLETENYSGSRFDIWVRLLQEVNIFKYILIGRGTTILANGRLYKPHSGHFYLIYGYGMIAYSIFMYEFFRFRKSMFRREYFAIVIPFLVIFTMNTLIGDLRSTFLYVILLAYIVDKKIRKNMEMSK